MPRTRKDEAPILQVIEFSPTDQLQATMVALGADLAARESV
jgi:hypothetical protein